MIFELTSDQWKFSATGNLKLRGLVYDSGGLVGIDELESTLNALNTIEESNRYLARLNGHYLIVHENTDHSLVVMDRIRSFPMFRAWVGSQWHVSDSAEHLRLLKGNKHFDHDAELEFAQTGYVVGESTLFEGIFQGLAGQVWRAESNDPCGELNIARYYVFRHTLASPMDFNVLEMTRKLDECARLCIDNLIETANGKHIVLPLSGGYDSRLIATLLKEQGYDNVSSFSYGVSGHRDPQFSRSVADALKIPWQYVEYTAERWHEAIHNSERRLFDKRASGWSSLPHYQDWLAVWYLRKNKLVPDESLFVPGHTGDFIAGGHIPESVFSKQKFTQDLLFEDICRAHYNLAPASVVADKQRLLWKARMLESVSEESLFDSSSYASAFQLWEWQERQAKYVVNSVRVYEHFGYDWWLPLWDREFMEFWLEVPLQLLYGRHWYIEYVGTLFEKHIDKRLGNAGDGLWVRNPILAKTKDLFPRQFVRQVASTRNLLYKMLAKASIAGSPLAFTPHLGSDEVLKLTAEGYSFNGIVAQSFLREHADLLRDGD